MLDRGFPSTRRSRLWSSPVIEVVVIECALLSMSVGAFPAAPWLALLILLGTRRRSAMGCCAIAWTFGYAAMLAPHHDRDSWKTWDTLAAGSEVFFLVLHVLLAGYLCRVGLRRFKAFLMQP